MSNGALTTPPARMHCVCVSLSESMSASVAADEAVAVAETVSVCVCECSVCVYMYISNETCNVGGSEPICLTAVDAVWNIVCGNSQNEASTSSLTFSTPFACFTSTKVQIIVPKHK
jgi:hypothetical protein